jgi:RimJ/RimL family protein N-acetyltransferase
MTFEIVELEAGTGLEQKFLDQVDLDPVDLFFFIYDWRYFRDVTRIYLAMKDGSIEGMLIIYKDTLVQTRGSIEAVEALLVRLDRDGIEIMGPIELEDLLKQYYDGEIKQRVMMMTMKKGEQVAFEDLGAEPLSADDADEIAELLRHADPNWWADITGERIRDFLTGPPECLCLGIKREGKLVSMAQTRLVEVGCNIFVVATHEAHRNKGYATSVVSAVLDGIFKRSDRAHIHVFTGNPPAIKVYSKVGFKPYKDYFVMKRASKVGRVIQLE